MAEEFFAGRFTAGDLRNIWGNVAGGRESVDGGQFERLQGGLWGRAEGAEVEREYPKDSWRYQDFSIIRGTTVRSNEHQYEERQRMEQQCTKFVSDVLCR